MGGTGGLDRVKRKLTRENAQGKTETGTGFLYKLDIFSERAPGSFEDGVVCQVSVMLF